MWLTSLTAVLVWLLAIPAFADVITFEGLGFGEQDPVITIGLATFDAEIAIQGAPQFGFRGTSGEDTGDAIPFSNPGNTFITGPGGFSTPETVRSNGGIRRACGGSIVSRV